MSSENKTSSTMNAFKSEIWLGRKKGAVCHLVTQSTEHRASHAPENLADKAEGSLSHAWDFLSFTSTS